MPTTLKPTTKAQRDLIARNALGSDVAYGAWCIRHYVSDLVRSKVIDSTDAHNMRASASRLEILARAMPYVETVADAKRKRGNHVR